MEEERKQSYRNLEEAIHRLKGIATYNDIMRYTSSLKLLSNSKKEPKSGENDG